VMSVTGLPGSPPVRTGIPVSDLSAGLYLAVGVLVALHDRDRTGTGRWVQTSLLESMIAMMDFQATRWTVDHEVPPQAGNSHPTLVPTGCYASADGYVNVAGSSARLLGRLCEALGLPDVPTDPRFSSTAKRLANRTALNELIAERLRAQSTAHWVEVLNAAGVPCGPVYHLDEVFADPQVQHLGMIAPVQHAGLGQLDIIRNAVQMTGVPGTVRAPSPELGADSDEVLADLDYSPAQIGQFRADGVV
jgi:crotonobetainyl-CoA:carnitine CoA-transferase CaiB-like acyl-CoA transferase